MKRFRKLASVMLSLSMLGSAMHVYAESIPDQEEPGEEILLSEEPAEETGDPEELPVMEEEPQETEQPAEVTEEEPEVTAEETPAPEETPVPEEPPAEEPLEEAVTYADEDPVITIPEELYLPPFEEYPLDVTVEGEGYSLDNIEFTYPYGDTEVNVIRREDGFYVQTGEPERAVLYAVIKLGGGRTPIYRPCVIYTENWVEGDTGLLMFDGADAAPKTAEYRLAGHAEGMAFELVPPLEDIDNPVYSITNKEDDGTGGVSFTVTPRRAGRSVRFIELDDPNGKEGFKFHLFAGEVLVTEETVLEEIRLSQTEAQITAGHRMRIRTDLIPETFNPELIRAESRNPDIVTVEQDSADPYTFILTAAGEGETEVVFSADGEMAEAVLTVRTEVPYFRLPLDISYPLSSSAMFPVDTNVPEYELEVEIPDWDYGYSCDQDNLNFYIPREVNTADAVAYVTLTPADGSAPLTAETTIHAGEFFEFSTDRLLFTPPDDMEPKYITVRAYGPFETADFTLVPDPDGMHVFDAEETGSRRGSRTFRITPDELGYTKMNLQIEDINRDDDGFIQLEPENRFVAVLRPVEEIHISADGMTDAEELWIQPGGETNLIIGCEPVNANIFTVTGESSDPELVTLEPAESGMPGYYFVYAGEKEGEAEITFRAGEVVKTLPVHVRRAVVPDTDVISAAYIEGGESEMAEFTISLNGNAAGRTLQYEVKNLDGEPYLEGDSPLDVQYQQDPDNQNLYHVEVTPLREESALITFYVEYGTAFRPVRLEADVLAEVGSTPFHIPNDIYYQYNAYTPFPIEAVLPDNVSVYATATAPDGWYVNSTLAEGFNADGLLDGLYDYMAMRDADEMDFEVTVKAVDETDDERKILGRDSGVIHVGHWLEYDTDALVFKGKNAKPQTFAITASGPYAGKEFDIASPIGDSIWTKENVSQEGDTRVYSISPDEIGLSVIFAVLPDLNNEAGDPVYCMLEKNVLVSENRGAQSLVLYRAGWYWDEMSEEQKEEIRITSMVLEPGQEKRVAAISEPRYADPFKVTASSSKPALVTVTQNPAYPYEFILQAAEDTEGTATVTFKYGTKTVTLPVTVHRLIKPEKDYVPMVYTGTPQKDKVSISVALRQPAAGRPLYTAVLDDTGQQYPDGEEPVTVELTKITDTEYECVLTPNREENAQIRFYTYGTYPFYDDSAITEIWAEVRVPEQLRWDENSLRRLEEEKRNGEEFDLRTEQSGAVIEYAIQYFDEETDARDAVGTEVPEEEWKVYNGINVVVESESMHEISWARITARAHKDGWLDADEIDTVFPIRFDEWIDELLADYMQENGLSLSDIKDELIVLQERREEGEPVKAGVPESVSYTGSPITFSDDLCVYYGIRRLMENVDYKITYANNTNAADATAKKAPTVKITGYGRYAKTWSQKFSIVKFSLLSLCRDFDYGEEPVLIEFDRKDSGRTVLTADNAKSAPSISLSPYLINTANGKKVTLKKGTDYEVYYYPVTGFDPETGPVIDTEHPLTTLERVNGEYAYAVFALPGSKKISGTKEEFEAAGTLSSYISSWMVFFKVFNTTDKKVDDISKAKLSKSIGTLNLEMKYNEYAGTYYYDSKGVYDLFTGTSPKITLKIGTRKLDVTTVPMGSDADVFIQCEEPLHAGTNYLWLSGMETEHDGLPLVTGTRALSFTIKPKTAISSKTVKVTNLVKSLKLDDYDHFELWNEDGLDLDKLSVTGNKDDIKLITKSGNIELQRFDDPRFRYRSDYQIEISRYTGGTASLAVTFRAEPERGYTGSLTVKIPIQVPTLAELKAAGKLRAEFEDWERPYTTAQYSQAGASPKVRLIYTNARGEEFDLQEGVDFKVKYTNNKAISTASKHAFVTITGMGFFKGTLKNELEFLVVPANLDERWLNRLEPKAADITYNAKGKAGYFRSAPKIYDGTKALKAGTDYKVLETWYSYGENATDENGQIIHVAGDEVRNTDKPLPGTVIYVDQKIRLTSSKYICDQREDEEAGVYWIHAEYRIITKAMSIASAKVTVNGGKAVYLGNNWSVTPEIEVVLKKADVDPVTKKKVDRILKPKDYEIISIDKNWLPGTATMVIQGKGNYAGTKKVTFKITKTPFIK